MKKALSLILELVLCMSLCACGGSETVNNTTDTVNTVQDAAPVVEPKATIKTRDGNTETLTSSELCAIYFENQAKYSSKYQTADATVTGTVESVSEHLEYFGNTRKMVYDIKLKEGWEIIVLAECHKEVIELSAGDKVRVSSELQLVHFNVVTMQSIGIGSSGWHDDTTIEVVE